MPNIFKQLFATLTACAALGLFSNSALANPIMETLEFEMARNQDGKSIDVSYLSMVTPGNEKADKMVVQVLSGENWVTVGEDWHYDENATVANGGSGDMDYHEMSITVPCQKTGTQEYRVARIHIDSHGDADIYEAHTDTVDCTAAAESETATDGNTDDDDTDSGDNAGGTTADDRTSDDDDTSGCAVAAIGKTSLLSLWALLLAIF